MYQSKKQTQSETKAGLRLLPLAFALATAAGLLSFFLPQTAATGPAVNAAQSPTNVFPVLGMAWIQPGTFIMGSPANEPDSQDDERPQMMVTLTKGFWIGVHPVTQAEYQAVIGSNPSTFSGKPNNPVERLLWDAAVAYCTKLTINERKAGHIPANWAYRLPTEAEWEYCARAGARTTRFSYGDDLSYAALNKYSWGDDGGKTTHPVEQKLMNPWGLMDMHGNVLEWCQDWYARYPGGSVTDPQGPATGSDYGHAYRGGYWGSKDSDCRSARRILNNPGSNTRMTGLRAVLAPGDSASAKK
jgi:formylglycine-generating enzyme required for sulfatase activity